MSRLKCIFLYGFSILSLHAADFLEENQEIIEAFKAKGYSSFSGKDIESTSIAGSNTGSISIVYLEDNQFICKELKGLKDEIKNLEKLKYFVGDYVSKIESLEEFPPRVATIAQCKMHLLCSNKEFAIFEKASGESVFDLMLEGAKKGYGWCNFDSTYTKKNLEYHFYNIGYACASFYLLNGRFDEESNQFISVLHGDLHVSNVFYDIMSNKTTLIDYETMSSYFEKKISIYEDIGRLFSFSKNEIIPLVTEIACKDFTQSQKKYILNEEEKHQLDLFIKSRLLMIDHFFRSLGNGFTDAFKKEGYNVDLSSYNISKI